MKWLIILALFMMLAGIIALRYRRQIQTARQLWLMFRQFRKSSKPAERNVEKKAIDKNLPLVRCARCGMWIPQNEALNLRSKTFYCSSKCMEKAAHIESLVD
jgi:hypothetical protein